MSEIKSTAKSAIMALGIILLTMTIFCSSASAECSTCNFVDSWINEAIHKISGNYLSEQVSATPASQPGLEVKSVPPEDGMKSGSQSARGMLVSPQEISKEDVILDGSDNPASFIPGAIQISYREFVDNNNTASLKNISDIAAILGDAGISRSDPLVVYGECQPCGGGPSTATYVYWLLRYMGHEDIRVLNGGIDAWVEAGLPVENSSITRPMSTYSPVLNEGLYASYDYVMSGKAQIVDARSKEEFEYGSIPGAINIPYDKVLDNKLIRGESELEGIFSNLTLNKPVVVFTTTGTKASVMWFTLTMLGYDAKMYTYRDWEKADREKRRQLQEINRSI